jgi:hypothetical protein
MCNVEYKKSIIESTIASAKLYYDDRIKNIESSTSNLAQSVENTKNESTAVAAAAAVQSSTSQAAPSSSGSSGGSSLFGLKKKLSSKKKSEKKSSFQELKIKEETERESDGFLESQLDQQPAVQEYEDTIDLLEDNLDENAEFDLILNSNMSSNEIATLLINKIDRKVQQLDRLWQELNRQSLNYNNTLINFYNNLQLLQKSFELVNQKLNQNEQLAGQINIVNHIESDKLADELEKVKTFQLKISSYQPLIDNMCTQYSNIFQELQHCDSIYIKNQERSSACGQSATNTITAKFDDLNLRWSNLQNQLQENYLHLYSLIESSGADIFLKLADGVQPPWQRAVSASNKIPYYIK